MSLHALIADRIFTGDKWLNGHAVLSDNGTIDSIVLQEDIPPCTKIQTYDNAIIAPAFIDLQIYGASGCLLAVNPTATTLEKIYAYCKAGGASHFLPTVATNTYEVFYACIDAVRAYWQRGGQGIIGLHIEGPWINKEKRGAHIEELIHAPTIEQATSLLEYGKGVIKMITLAPEVCSMQVVELIKSFGVVISVGHSNATFQQATYAFDNGIGTATHLYNAMSALQHRAPGLVGAIMLHNKVMCSVIPDGYHVDFPAISIAKELMKERLFTITDAVTDAYEGYYPHTKEGDKYVSNGVLSGSALTMAKAVKNCVEHAGIELGEALRMASLYPANVIGIQNKLGRIERGFESSLVVLKNNYEVETLSPTHDPDLSVKDSK